VDGPSVSGPFSVFCDEDGHCMEEESTIGKNIVFYFSCHPMSFGNYMLESAELLQGLDRAVVW
jgi:hypothetical protein